jgi:hypothetical protein
MTASSPREAAGAVALCAALAPYNWRRFTPEWLARRALSAYDRHGLAELLGTVPGAEIGSWPPPGLADADDPRLSVLVKFLGSHQWTRLTLRTLCDRLLKVLGEAT